MAQETRQKYACRAVGLGLAVVMAIVLFLSAHGRTSHTADARKNGTDEAATLSSQDASAPACQHSAEHRAASGSLQQGTSVSSKQHTHTHHPGSSDTPSSDAFTDRVNDWLSEIGQRDDLTKPPAAREAFQSLGQEYDRIGTIQGRLLLQIDDVETPVFDGMFYVRRTEKDPDGSGHFPWRYEIRLADSKTGWNVLSHTDLKGGEDVPAWRDANEASTGQENDKSLPPLLRLLPYMPLSPVTLMRVPEKNREGFFKSVITGIHQTQPEEEAGTDGGPFWVFDRVNMQYWLSEDGELRRLQTVRRFPRDGGGFDVEKTFDKYEQVEGIRYPTVMTTRLTAKGPSGMEYVKARTGKQSREVTLMLSLTEIRINDELPDALFQRDSGK